MQQQRQVDFGTSPWEEDTRLFIGDIVQTVALLVPHITHGPDGTVQVLGFISTGQPVDVVFAGRRAGMAMPVISKLRARLARASQDAKPEASPDLLTCRWPARLEGVWRRRFSRDAQGWQTHRHQFIAARWLVMDTHGEPATYGELVRR